MKPTVKKIPPDTASFLFTLSVVFTVRSNTSASLYFYNTTAYYCFMKADILLRALRVSALSRDLVLSTLRIPEVTYAPDGCASPMPTAAGETFSGHISTESMSDISFAGAPFSIRWQPGEENGPCRTSKVYGPGL